MDPDQQKGGQFTPYVQPFQAGYVQTATPSAAAAATAYYPAQYQQQYAAYQPVVAAFPASQMAVGAQPTYPMVGYYPQAGVVSPYVQATSAVSATSGVAASSLAQPQPKPATAAVTTVPAGQLTEEQKKYKEQYEQWQASYQTWLQQNKNHPDQKLFQEWQQQMQMYQQQYTQVMGVKPPDQAATAVSQPQFIGPTKPEAQQKPAAGQPPLPPTSQPPMVRPPTPTQYTATSQGPKFAPATSNPSTYLHTVPPVVQQYGNQYQAVPPPNPNPPTQAGTQYQPHLAAPQSQIGYQAQPTGPQTQNSGYGAPENSGGTPNQNTGYQNKYMPSTSQGNDLQSGYPRSQNQGFGGQSQGQAPSYGKPSPSQNYQGYKQGYGQEYSEEGFSQGNQFSGDNNQEDYGYEENDDTYDQYGAEQHGPSQYNTRPPRPQFGNQQNQFPRPQGEGMRPRGPRFPFGGQHRPQQQPNQRADFRPRGGGPNAMRGPGPRGPQPRGGSPRGPPPHGPRGPGQQRWPPFPDQFLGQRQQRPQFPSQRFERPPPRQPSPQTRPPVQSLMNQDIHPSAEATQNFDAMKAEEPRFKPQQQDTRLRSPQPDTRFRAPQPDTRFRTPQPDTRFRAQQPDTRFRAPQPDTRFRAPQPDTRFRAPQPDTRFRAPQSDTRFRAPQSDTRFRAPNQNSNMRANSMHQRPTRPPISSPSQRPARPRYTPPYTMRPSSYYAQQASATNKTSATPAQTSTTLTQQPKTPPVKVTQPSTSVSSSQSIPSQPATPKIISSAPPVQAPVTTTTANATTSSLMTAKQTEAQPKIEKKVDVANPPKPVPSQTPSKTTTGGTSVENIKQPEPKVDADTLPKTSTDTKLPEQVTADVKLEQKKANTEGTLTRASLEIELLRKQQEQLNALKEIGELQQNRKNKQEDEGVEKKGSMVEQKDESKAKEPGSMLKKDERCNETATDNVLSKEEKSRYPCTRFPSCGLAEDCEFYHPMCKFDYRCKKPDCPFWHTVPLEERYSGKMLHAAREGPYFDDGYDVPADYDDRPGYSYDDRLDPRALYPGSPYRRRPDDYARRPPPPEDFPEYYEGRGYPARSRDERPYFDEDPRRDRFDRLSPPPPVRLERGRDWEEDRYPLPPREYERYPDERRPYRDRLYDRELDALERDRLLCDVEADRELYEGARERELAARELARRHEDDPIYLEREREWRIREEERRRDPSYDDPLYLRDPLYDLPPERRPLPADYDRYPELYDRLPPRELEDRRRLYDDYRRDDKREARLRDDEGLLRDRFLDRDRDPPVRREAFDYNHGGRAGNERDGHARKPREEEAKPKPKPKVVAIGTLLETPGREKRPDRIVFIFRGVPGCGKTHIARLIKDKELACGAPTPRILSLDDYFLQETSSFELDPETGKKVEIKGTEYVYEPEVEESYRKSLFKSFNKTLDDGFFPMVILDCVNDKVEHFERFWSQAKQKGFEVYLAEITADVNDCVKRNTRSKTLEDINKLLEDWEETPVHHTRLDVRSLLQDAAITEVEMEAVEETEKEGEGDDEEDGEKKEEDEGGEGEEDHLAKSRWDDTGATELQLDKLDGLRLRSGKRKAHGESPPDYDDDDDDDPYDEREEDMRLGKKRVRWADIEERKHLEHRRKIGFCIGTDWSLFTNPDAEIPK